MIKKRNWIPMNYNTKEIWIKMVNKNIMSYKHIKLLDSEQ